MPFEYVYAVSPDWLKLVFILSPWASLVLSVWICSRVKMYTMPAPRAERLFYRALENENRTLRERLEKLRAMPRVLSSPEPMTIAEAIALMEIEEALSHHDAQENLPDKDQL